MRARIACLAVCAMTACGDLPATQVLVHFTADESLLAEAVALRVRVFPQDGDVQPVLTRPIEPGGPLHMIVPVVPRGGDASRRFRIEGALLDTGEEVLVRAEASIGFAEHELLEVWLAFDPSCGECAGGYTCVRGECVAACFEGTPRGETDESEPVACPGEPTCDCPCTADTCVDGRCVPSLPVAAAAVGRDHACALSTDGKLWCWGVNTSGQLGTGDTDNRDRPARVELPMPATAVAAGQTHTCAVAGGALYCWGDNGSNQLGTGGSATTTPVQVGTSTDWERVAAGADHTCGLRTDGSLFCWGAGGGGQLGTGSFDGESTPAAVTGRFTYVDAGDDHTCAIGDDGTLFCWGRHGDGRLGLGELTANVDVPTAIGDPASWLHVAGSREHTCGVDSAGAPWCWGGSGSGKVGDVSLSNVWSPSQVVDETGFVRVGTGVRHSCGLRADGTASCWGTHLSGELGTGEPFGAGGPLPARVLGDGWVDLWVGDDASCVARADGSLWCFGRNFAGLLGIGGGPDQTRPRRTCLDP